MKQQGVFFSPLDEILVHCRVTPSIKFAATHLYTWVERDTVRVIFIKCHFQEHNAMSLARVPTQTARSGGKCTNHGTSALVILISTIEIQKNLWVIKINVMIKMRQMLSLRYTPAGRINLTPTK